MSGAEALFVFQLIKGVYDLCEITAKAVDRARNFSREVKYVPKEFDNLLAVLPLIEITLQRTQERAATLDKKTVRALNNVFQRMRGTIQQIRGIFEKFHLSSEYTGIERLIAAFQSIRKDDDIRRPVEELTQYLATISSHTTALTPTPEEIAARVSSDLETRLGQSVLQAIRQLRDRPRHRSLSTSNLPQVNDSRVYNDNSHQDIEQSSQKSIQAHTVQIYNNQTFFSHPNAHLLGRMPTADSVLPLIPIDGQQAEVLGSAPMRDLMLTRSQMGNASLPIHVTGWDQDQRAARAQFEPQQPQRLAHMRSNSSLQGLIPESSLQPQIELRSRSRSRSRSSLRSRASSTNSTDSLNQSIFSSPYSPTTSPLSDDGAPWPSNSLHPDTIAIKDANSLLATASDLVPTANITNPASPASAMRAADAYHRASRKFLEINARDPNLAVRKYRGLTQAHLGLTLVTKRSERDAYMGKARGYNDEACAAAHLAAQGGSADHLSSTHLDKAAVKAREARILEKKSRPGTSDAGTVAKMRFETFDMFKRIVGEFEGRCEDAADYDTLAQAHMGCGEMARMLMGMGQAAQMRRKGVEEAEEYFDMALACVEGANGGFDDPGEEVRLNLKRTRGRIYASRGSL